MIEQKTYLSLELQAVDSYVYVLRAADNSSALLLEPSTDAKVHRCCLIGAGDLISFSSSNVSITVTIPRDEVQVGSSIPMEVTSPKPSTSFDNSKVAETPTARRVKSPESSSGSLHPFSTAKMVGITQQDENNDAPPVIQNTNKGFSDIQVNLDGNIGHDNLKTPAEGVSASNHLDTLDDEDPTESDNEKSGQPAYESVVTKVSKVSKKRRAASDEDETPRARKKSRSASIPPITTIDEEYGKDDDLVKPRKRGRPKRSSADGIVTPKPQQQGPSVVIPSKSKNAGAPSYNVKSSKASLERSSFDATIVHGTKPNVVFSSSNFEELTQLLKSFKSFATVTEDVTEDTDFVW
jgi:hypothetical protein